MKPKDDKTPSTRRRYSAEEKVRLLKLHLVENKPVSSICDQHQIHPTMFYQWQKTFFGRNMKRSKLKPFIVAVMVLAVVGVPFLLHQWKLGSDRAGCLLNMRNMHQTIYSVGGMRGVGAGQQYPGGPRELLKGLGEYATLPRCPSGGTYSFGIDTTYSINLNENIRCSHAEDMDHRWPDETTNK